MPKILTTGDLFVTTRYNIRGLSSVLEKLIFEVKNEIILCTYSLGKQPHLFLKLLIDAARSGIMIHLIINSWEKEATSVRNEINEVLKLDTFQLYDFNKLNKGTLHAKVIAFDGLRLIMGSSNFSWSANYLNHEINLLLENEEAREIIKMLHDVINLFPNIQS